MFKNVRDILRIQKTHGYSLFEIAIMHETSVSGEQDSASLLVKMEERWCLMKKIITQGLDDRNLSIGGRILNREAIHLKPYFDPGKSVSGPTMTKAIAYAFSTMEVNISMGKIVAAPTAGACGVLPATLKTIQENHGLSDQRVVEALFVAGLIGALIAEKSSLSGAQGGCQAEIGSASAMASASAVYLLDGTPEQAFDAAAIAIYNLMGLICDPVAGLVEVPCHKRNAIGTANAIICTEMAMAGLHSIIPLDEVIGAMKLVGDSMPPCHRETAKGGIANTPTGNKISSRLYDDPISDQQ